MIKSTKILLSTFLIILASVTIKYFFASDFSSSLIDTANAEVPSDGGDGGAGSSSGTAGGTGDADSDTASDGPSGSGGGGGGDGK